MGSIQNYYWERLNDYELLYYALQNQEHAWILIQKAYQNHIDLNVSRYRQFTDEDKVELKQECLCSLLLALEEFREDQGASFYTYVCRRIENIIVTKMRRNATFKRKTMRNMYSLDATVNEKETSYWVDFVKNDQWEFEGSLLLQFQEAKKQEQKVLDTCSELEQQIYQYYRQGYRYHEIAKLLFISKKKVDNTIQKIRKKL